MGGKKKWSELKTFWYYSTYNCIFRLEGISVVTGVGHLHYVSECVILFHMQCGKWRPSIGMSCREQLFILIGLRQSWLCQFIGPFFEHGLLRMQHCQSFWWAGVLRISRFNTYSVFWSDSTYSMAAHGDEVKLHMLPRDEKADSK